MSSFQKQRVPKVDEFKISTKTGAHSFFEIMKTTLSLPVYHNKKTAVGATVPIPLQSEAMWKNGELSVQVKEIGKILYTFFTFYQSNGTNDLLPP